MHPKAFLDTTTQLITQALAFDKPSDALMSQFFKEHRQVGSKERHWMGDALYDLLRHRLFLEAAVKATSASGVSAPIDASQAARQPTKSSPKRAAPRLLALMALQRTAPTDKQRQFLQDALTEVEQAWLHHAQAIVPDATAPEQTHNLPDWLASKLQEQLQTLGRGDEFVALMQSLQQAAPVDVRTNVQKIKRDALQQQLQQLGLATLATPYSPWGLRIQPSQDAKAQPQPQPTLTQLAPFAQGCYEVQDEGSQLLALLLGAKREEMVADFCAGAGGKTLALAMMMRNTGRLYAIDTHAHRLSSLAPRLARAGQHNVHTLHLDNEADPRLRTLFGKMDRVLVDAPCTGLGTLRRSPDLKWRVKSADIQTMQTLQSRILSQAAKLLKPGGRLVYATCSLLVEENETVAAQFSTQHPDFTPLAIQDILLHAKITAPQPLCSADGQYLRMWPHITQTDGFFAAAWQRKV